MSLTNLAIRLADVGRRDEALRIITVAIDIRHNLANRRPAVHREEYNQSLRVLSLIQELPNAKEAT